MADQKTQLREDEAQKLVNSEHGKGPSEAEAMEKAQEDAAHERETERGYQ